MEEVQKVIETVRVTERAAQIEARRDEFSVFAPAARGIEFSRQRIFFFNYDMGALTGEIMRHAVDRGLRIVVGDRAQENLLVVRERALVSIQTSRPPVRFEARLSRGASDLTGSSGEEAMVVAESL